MTDGPYFSIIIPVYNRAGFIKKTIESVFTQTFENWELIIVDDASTDNTVSVIEECIKNEKRARLIKQSKNQERGATRNRGIEDSKGKYICLLDSDDYFEHNHLSNFYSHIQNRKEPVALFYSNMFLIENGKKTRLDTPLFDEQNKFAYLLWNPLNPTKICVHHAIFQEIKYDPSIPGIEDLDLGLHVALKFPIIQLLEHTNTYSIHPEAYSEGDKGRFLTEINYFNYVFNKPELKNILPSSEKNKLLSMCHYHLSLKYDTDKEKTLMYKSIITSFILFPKGYNGKTNKTLLVLFLYNIPLIGPAIKFINSALRSK